MIHSGVETSHYTAQEAQFLGGKEEPEDVKLARWHRVKPKRSKCFICVLVKTSVCHCQSGGGGQLKTKQWCSEGPEISYSQKAVTCSRKSCKRMCNCNRGRVEGWRGWRWRWGCSKRAQKKKHTFLRENSRLGLQSYTDTSGQEWWRAGEEGRGEERKSEEGWGEERIVAVKRQF